MTTRKKFDNAFGPKLIEAVVLVVKDEINLLRTEHSKSLRTEQQVLDAISVKEASLPDYES